MRLRATFDNQNNALFPSQFVNARLLVEVARGVVLLAHGRDSAHLEHGVFVYLVKPDSR